MNRTELSLFIGIIGRYISACLFLQNNTHILFDFLQSIIQTNIKTFVKVSEKK